MNGHIGQDRAGYEKVIGHHAIGGRNAEGKLSKPKRKTKMIKQRYKLEKLKDHEVVTQFRDTFSEKITNRNVEGLDDWASFKNSITEAAEESLELEERTAEGRNQLPGGRSR